MLLGSTPGGGRTIPPGCRSALLASALAVVPEPEAAGALVGLEGVTAEEAEEARRAWPKLAGGGDDDLHRLLQLGVKQTIIGCVADAMNVPAAQRANALQRLAQARELLQRTATAWAGPVRVEWVEADLD